VRLAALRLHNWQCYPGHSDLLLDAKVYGVTARHVDDAERSNWLGKTSLPAAVVFALTGDHDHRLDDDWITRGAGEGGVVLEFDTGEVVKRTRKRGKPTKLDVYADGRWAGKDLAQEAIYAMLGLSKSDLLATSIFPQGEMAALVTCKPEERLRVFTGWLQLEPLEVAEEHVRGTLSEFAWSSQTIAGNIASLRERATAVAGGTTLDALREQHTAVERSLAKAQEQLSQAQTDLGDNERLRSLHETSAAYDQLVEAGTKLAAEVKKKDPAALRKAVASAQSKDDDARSVYSAAQRDANQKLKLSRGEFDGVCPVAGMACPVAKEINAEAKHNVKLHKKAESALEGARILADDTRSALTSAQAELQEHERKQAQLDALRERAVAMTDEVEQAREAKPARDPEALRRRVQTLTQQVADDTAKLHQLASHVKYVTAVEAEIDSLTATYRTTEARAATAREALLIVGKQGAQRRVAEGRLAQIEAGANGMLTECAIPLSLQLQWSREGGDAAKACEQCGHPFPKTLKVKSCERCGADRGKNIINKLEIALSDRSGGSKDLVGAALRLSAAAWLRSQRHSRWSVALLDEPFGQLDARFRRVLGTHLATMLSSRYGFSQAFVIAHHSSVLDALPGRIEITASPSGSKARVVT
jgi:DNA repair exonuclease SbcCD ATPase subunit